MMMAVHQATEDEDQFDAAIRAVVAEPRLTLALRRAEDLRAAASRMRGPDRAARQLADLIRDGDDITSLAAVHALSAVPDLLADRVLLGLIVAADEPYDAHAAWALAARQSSPAAVAALIRLVIRGGFTAMLAERTLVEWSRFDAQMAIEGVRQAAGDLDTVGRQRLADLLVALPARDTQIGQLPLGHLMQRGTDGIVVVQPFLHARLDRVGTSLGAGDAGGIASLLRSLGNALGDLDDVDEVITITRRHDGESRSERLTSGHRVERIDFGAANALPWREAWVFRAQIEAQLLAIGEALADRRVVWHLRMAEVGTLAAAAVARRLGQAMVFTAVPDPHVVIDALQDSGRLDRSRFAVEDSAAQYWFRARMVERLTVQADRLTLLPRPTIERELIELVGIDSDDLAARAVVIPEGVDIAEIDRAAGRLSRYGVTDAVRRVIDLLPNHRRQLPWVLTVGRLHPAKGSQRIVEAVVGDPTLAHRVNVVIVGGDLGHPSPDEQSTVERIRRAARGAEAGVVTLVGHMASPDVHDMMAYAASHGGVYVCASDKEEFGLAIVEALAAGSVVVAPQRGGPRTYVDDGTTGVLCDTMSIDSLRDAIVRALALVDVPGRARQAGDMVRRELTVERMAERLGQVYRELVPASVAAK
jgi:glycosyltransferase involved in cell wall biosynthesis